MSWEQLASWWLEEVRDPAYDRAVTPVLLELLEGVDARGVVADIGCGDGRLIPVVGDFLGVRVVGLDLSEELVSLVDAPAVVASLPNIPFAGGTLGAAYAVLVLDHLEDHEAFFVEAARVVRPGGFLAVVSNHPVWTAPGSTPIADYDGEILWRPGSYFESGETVEPAGEGQVVFYHRSVSDILNAASSAGWDLVRMVEKPHHDEGADPGIPRLVGLRWVRRSEPA